MNLPALTDVDFPLDSQTPKEPAVSFRPFCIIYILHKTN